MPLAIGAAAPDFTLKGTPADAVTLSGHKGKDNVVLLFIPFAFSSICTEEFCSVRDQWNDLGKINAKIYGLSVDSVHALKAWKEKEKLPFELLSDFNKGVSRAYDAQHEKLGDWVGVAKRSAFVIDKEGKVAMAWVSDDPKVKPDVAAIKAVVQKLK
ncbi:MAG: redoxin domain-containing protein [Planctomycetota bacterium]